MYQKPVWQMIREAVTSIGGAAVSNAEIQDYVINHYGAVNRGTINDQIIACCVNRQSRTNYPENFKPRIANGRYDFLYLVNRGLVALYDPERHGKWEITFLNGRLIVRQFDDNAEISIALRPDLQQSTVFRILQQGAFLRPDIESPSRHLVKRYLDKRDAPDNNTAQEKALNKLFRDLCLENTSLEDVLLKVTTLNAFYTANIYNVLAVAQHIVDLGIDERLRQGDESLVADIASGHGIISIRGGKEIQYLSFASKYCSHHRPDDYPIYDSSVENILVYLSKVDGFALFQRETLHDITVFKQVLMKLHDYYGLQEFSLKQINQYLWQYGKEKFTKPYGLRKSQAAKYR